MAEKKSAAPAAQYGREELAESSAGLFGVPGEVLAGALHGVGKERLSVAEAKRYINQFLDRKVK
ncbi:MULTISPECIES: hypothetical protein [Cohnella]|uniref:hypothetical protein n=1 Tax=Cohnella TaxID=329857 RepID=UPI0009B9ABF0|nr:hypothetical protein [Cohnella massiliensis]MBN2981955.1 hypothetical protein [Cohnella algarum]